MADKVGYGWAGKGYVANMWVKYKLTLEGFNRFWDRQEGKCAGCEEEFAHPTRKEARLGVKPEVDHCHVGGNVRGLLCRRCNDFLGKVRDNQRILARLRDYLAANGEQL